MIINFPLIFSKRTKDARITLSSKQVGMYTVCANHYMRTGLKNKPVVSSSFLVYKGKIRWLGERIEKYINDKERGEKNDF